MAMSMHDDYSSDSTHHHSTHTVHARITQRQVVVASRQVVSQAIAFDPFVPIPFKDELIPIERTPRCNNPKLTCAYIRIVVNQMSKAFLNQAPHTHSSSRLSLHRVCRYPRLHDANVCCAHTMVWFGFELWRTSAVSAEGNRAEQPRTPDTHPPTN